MKKLNITIQGESFWDLEVALDEVKRLVEKEYLSSFNGNETGSYQFDIVEV